MQIANPISVAHLRRVNEQNLPHTAVVSVPVTTTGAGGRVTVTGHTTLRTLDCRLSLASASVRERLVAGGLEAEHAYVVAFEAGADVQLVHRLVVTGETATATGDVAFSHTLQVVLVDPVDRAGEFLRKVVATKVAA